MKLKMYKDYFIYLLFLKRKEAFILLIDLFIFIISARAFYLDYKSSIFLVSNSYTLLTLFILTLLKFLWDTYKIITDMQKFNSKSYYQIMNHEKIPFNDESFIELDKITPSRAEESSGFTKIDILNQNDFVFHSEMIDDHIRKQDLSLKLNNYKRNSIREFLLKEKDTLLPFFNVHFFKSIFENKYFFNQNKVCLSDDLDHLSIEVYCHKGSYFDTFLTNNICTKLIRTIDNNKLVVDGRHYFPVDYIEQTNEISLKEVSRSLMNNEIGVSTLGFTSDNYLVIWKQNMKAQSSSNLFVPTGSGSSDWADIIDGNFSETIRNGMARELWEESGRKSIGAHYKNIGETKILGFFRWVKRGGKPEFVGITKLHARLAQLKPEEMEVRRSRTKHEWKIESIEQLKSTIYDIKTQKGISIPLYMCLHSFEVYLNSNPDAVKEFLK
jgi:hypothetical protein